MSLLNDMLRDLAQRQPAEWAEDENQLFLHATGKSQKNIATWISIVIIFSLVFLLALAIKNFYIKVFDKNNSSSIVSLNTDHNVSEKKPTEQSTVSTPVVSTSIAGNTNAGSTANLVSQPAESHSDTQLKIDNLFEQANRALALNRLTSPIEDNAYQYFREILELNPGQAEARQGVQSIALHYLMQAQEQLQLGNQSQADDFILRAKFVDSDFTQKYLMSGSFSNAIASKNTVSTVSEIPQITTQNTTEAVAPSVSAQKIDQHQSVSESVKSFPVTEAASLSVEPTASWKDEQLAQKAQVFIQQGKTEQALALLKNFIVVEKQPIHSTTLLADIYLQQGNTQAVEILLTQAAYLPIVTKARISAQLLSAKGNQAEAITILEQHLSAADDDETYRTLLASLYHKTGNYEKSSVNYQRLLTKFGDKPAYWLGLALAFDGLAQYNSALQAYQHLREFPQLQEQVKMYTDQRIAALRRE